MRSVFQDAVSPGPGADGSHSFNRQDDEPKLSIVVVSWNTRELLGQCLESIGGQTVPQNGQHVLRSDGGLSLEVLVVDNGSSDGSVFMVQREFPWVRLFPNRENAGFARANNQAIVESRGGYVLLLNPDTEVQAGALDEIVRFMDLHPRAGAAGARLLNSDGSLQPSCSPTPTLFREFWRLFHLDALYPLSRYPMENWLPTGPREVDITQGAALVLRRAALDEVGLLDDGYFIYSEEVDLCHRLRQRGWKIHWVPQSSVVHHGGRSTRQVAELMFLRLYEAKVLYFRKHHPMGTVALYKLLLILAAAARLALSPLALLEAAPRRRRHLTLAGYYLRLIRSVPGF